MRCWICHRPLIHCAVPGLEIGPKCAADRGLLPDRPQRFRRVEVERVEDGQIDWIALIDTSNGGATSMAKPE